MKRSSIFLIVAALALSGCGPAEPAGPTPAEAAATAAAAEKAAAEKAAADAAAAAAEAAKVAAANAPLADEAAWVAACTTAGTDAGICACTAKETIKTLGANALFPWVWEGYVNRDGMAQMRSRKWLTDNGYDTAAQQKFADAVGTCYVTQ